MKVYSNGGALSDGSIQQARFELGKDGSINQVQHESGPDGSIKQVRFATHDTIKESKLINWFAIDQINQ